MKYQQTTYSLKQGGVRCKQYTSFQTYLQLPESIKFAARQTNVANRIAQEQLDETKKPKLGIVTQLESISRSIRHLDDTVEKLKKIDDLNNQ